MKNHKVSKVMERPMDDEIDVRGNILYTLVRNMITNRSIEGFVCFHREKKMNSIF